MKIKRLLTAVLWFGMALGVHAGETGGAAQAILEAKAANAKADSIQGAWVTTSGLIKKAEAAAAKGDEAAAIEYAAKAKKEAELAYAQAAYEQENWSPPPYAR